MINYDFMTLKQFKNKPVVKILTNKYLIVFIIFIVWIVFFDENSIINHFNFNEEIEKLENEKEYYKSEILKDSSLIESLEDKENQEKYAREKYNMKKDNEDIYIIEYDTID